MSYVNDKGADQPAHPCSLISAFVVRCLDSIIFLVSIFAISRLSLASVAEQVGLSFTWSKTPEDRFSRDEAHEPRHEKTSLCHKRTTKAQISLRISTFVFAAWIVAYLFFLNPKFQNSS